MIYVTCNEKELNLWWDEREDKKTDMLYKIIVNGKNCVYTNKRYFDFKNLKAGEKYDFEIQLVDNKDNVIGRVDYFSANTLPANERIDVTQQPYFAVGDNKTDNTDIIQRAIDENPNGTEIYLPLGRYVCDKLNLNGDFNLHLDVGASLTSPQNLTNEKNCQTNVNHIVFDDEIKVWWNYHKLNKGEKFVVSINGEKYSTTKSHYNFKNLTPETTYNIKVIAVDALERIIKKIGEIVSVTRKKKRRLDVTKPPYNAIGDGVTLNTKAFQRAINDCSINDCVYVPNGDYLVGALDLKSNTELYLEDKATILGSIEPRDYLPKVKSRFEGWEMLCYRSLLNIGAIDNSKGCDTENIVIRGGKIFGGGSQLRTKIIETERPAVLKLYGMENEDSPHALYSSVIPGRTRGRTLCCSNAKNVIVANTIIGNAPAWNLHFIYCEDITVCGCKVISQGITNGDGIDPDSTKNCTIFDMKFETGDDSVSIKSGKNPEGYYIARPSENINVFDCVVKEGHGITIGSEMSGGVSNVNIWNIQINVGHGICIKTREKRGGYVKNVNMFNCETPTISIGEYGCVDDGEAAPEIAKVSNIHIEDATLKGIRYFITSGVRQEASKAFSVCGLGNNNPVENLSLKNINLKYRSMLPYQDVELKNVKNLTIENISCEGSFNS